MRLDSHQHFWNYSAEQYPWIQNSWPIKWSFLPSDLAPLLTQAGFDGCIAVQARQTLEESRWLLELADQSPIIKGVVGWVDLRSERVEEQLAQFASHPKSVGVRHVVQDEPDDDFMVRPEFLRGISKLKQFKLRYDILIFPKQLPAAIKLVQQFPEQPFVLDHIAKPSIKDGALSPWREQMQELAKAPNLMCKVSGMVTEAKWQGWRYDHFVPYLDVVAEAFGTNRLMYGSDWPVCLLAGSYPQVHSLTQRYFASQNEIAKAKIFGGNAAQFYLNR
ncbi:MAG: amidohydrolase 2 [Verrucomicrobia bacterium]|jgi:L-fuconolactonase|nr:amidohydrolase 2 [Verrucomicrobiota bacterium]